MNILFITFNGVKDAAFGGAKASRRNYFSLKKLGNVFLYSMSKHSNLLSAVSIIQGNLPPLLNSDIKKINEIVSANNIDIVFYDSSAIGPVVKSDKVKSIVFCHNVEKDYNKVRFVNKRGLKKMLYQLAVNKAEGGLLRTADKICAFTKRDAHRLEELYHRKDITIIPLSIEDNFQDSYKIETQNDDFTCLIFGPSAPANDEAVEWFTSNVSPHIKVKLVIAGKGMDKYKYLENDKISVLGYVDSIQELYNMADCVAIPLLSGGGMKIKTAEALMFGKYIFGTTEAFVGYEDVLTPDVSCTCNSAQDFINSINMYSKKKKNRFIPKAREIYLNNYSIEATNNNFEKLLNANE